MRAVAQLIVQDKMEVTINLRMTVEELNSLLNHFGEIRSWPVGSLHTILHDTLSRLKTTFDAEQEIRP